MDSVSATSRTQGNSALNAAITTIKNARDTPGKAALKIINDVAQQSEQSNDAQATTGQNLNVKA